MAHAKPCTITTINQPIQKKSGPEAALSILGIDRSFDLEFKPKAKLNLPK